VTASYAVTGSLGLMAQKATKKAATDKVAQKRHWTVTVQSRKNTDESWCQEMIDEVELRIEHLVKVKQIRYWISQVEVGDTGRRHLQAYVEFMRPKRLSEAKSTLGWGHAHLEHRWGTRTQAREYCMKDEQLTGEEWSDDTRFQAGEWREDKEGLSGQRSLSDVAIDLILNGFTPHQVARQHPKAYFTHSRKIWDLYEALKQTRPWEDDAPLAGEEE